MTDDKLNIKNWSADDRPREKLISKGINSLSDAELIAILIGSGNKTETAVDLSKRLLSTFKNNLNELGKKGINDLIKFNGIGEAKAISIIAALELGKRRKAQEIMIKAELKHSSHVFELMQSLLTDLPYEEFWILLLSRNNKLIEKIKLSQGGLTGTVIDVKIIMKLAIEKLASGIILCHNHPSGNTSPSAADKNITQKIKEAATFFDINLLDHIIIGDDSYYSFADDGMLY